MFRAHFGNWVGLREPQVDAWRRLVNGQLTTIEIEGTHGGGEDNYFAEPYVSGFAKQLLDFLPSRGEA